MNRPLLYEKIFLILLVGVTLAFAWLLSPFSGAIFWAFIFAILFRPLFDRILEKMPGRRNLAAVLTLLICQLIAILPLSLIVSSLLQEGGMLYQKIQSGEINFSRTLTEIYADLPDWITHILGKFGISDLADFQEKTTDGMKQAGHLVARQVLAIGQNIFGFAAAFFITIYLLFFLLRDGKALANATSKAIPLNEERKYELLNKFIGVIRATVKGNLIVAMVQGSLGGLIFWILGIQAPILWGSIMAFLSLFPAGAGIIWLPTAIYLLSTGAIVKGVVLMVFGATVIGLIDNILRPILVGKDTQMPDYVVLISTLGGLSLFGLNGFVIGPVIAALFMTSWKMFSDDSAERLQENTSNTPDNHS